MNKKIKIITLYAIVLGAFVCCNKNKDDKYFNGDILYLNNRHKVLNVTSKDVKMYGANYGMIAVYDSLLICWNPKLANYFFNIFNVDTGEEIGSFCNRGQGPEDAASINCIYQFFKKENDLMTLLYAANEGKLFFWNLSKSIENRKTVFDTIVSYKNNRIFFQFYKSEDILFAYKPSDYLNKEEVATPFYEKRTILTNHLIQDYPIYKKQSVRNSSAAAVNTLDFFFYTWDVIKPDGSKIAQAMRHLPQINILDTNTGDVVGYRLQNSPDYSLLEKDMEFMNIYYNSIHADDKYIYASYWGKGPWDTNNPFLNTIHVLDWSGKLLYKLMADRPYFRIWLDQVRNRLYTTDYTTDEVYYLDLNELNL